MAANLSHYRERVLEEINKTPVEHLPVFFERVFP